MPKPKPVYATADEVATLRSDMESGCAAATNAGEGAAQAAKTELGDQLGQLSRTVTANAEQSKAAEERVKRDSMAYCDKTADDVKKLMMSMLAQMEATLAHTQANLDAQLQALNLDLRKTFADELEALSETFDGALGAAKAELSTDMERWAREAAEAMVEQRRQIDDSIEQRRQEAAANAEAVKQAASMELQQVLAEKGKVEAAREERSQRSESEMWLKLDRLTDLLQEHKDTAKEHTESMRRCASGELGDFRAEATRRLDDLTEHCEKLHDAVSEVENLPTRRVDWVIRNVSRRLRPSSASKACLHTSWFSPKFDCAGAHGLQLELQLFRPGDPPVDGEAAGDCAVFLWACKGINLVYKLYVGTKSAQLEKVFNGRVPYGTQRFCFLKDQVNKEDDSLRISLEILEAVREIQHPIKPLPVAEGDDEAGNAEDKMKPLEGLILFRRHVNNRLFDQVKSQVEMMRSRMVRKIEWRLEQAAMLRRCFPSGEPMCSPTFAAAGVENLQFLFYPCGYGGATDGFCSVFLYALAGVTLKCTLWAGSQRRDASHFYEDSGAFGRTNFCRFESAVDEDTDTIVVALDIDEAHQDVQASVAHPTVQPGDRRTQSQLDGAVPGSVESVVKLHRAPGKPTPGLEDKRVLPSLWTAKSLADRTGPADTLHPFEDLKGPGGKRSSLASPTVGGSSPLGASRSMPSLTKDSINGDALALALLSKSTGDCFGGVRPRKVRAGSHRGKNMASTLQVIGTEG